MSGVRLECRTARSTPTRAPLVEAALTGELAGLGLCVARSADDIELPAERLDDERRAALSARLEHCLAPLRPHVAVLDAVRALRAPGTWAVVTGQQPGLCGGPLYTLYKALQAVRLARRLAQAWERPVVALFWNHADDHDVAEVHHLHLLNENLDLQRAGLASLSSGRTPLGRLVLDAERHALGGLRGFLEHSLARRNGGPAQQRVAQEALELFLPRAGETLATAFTRTLTGLLGPQGLVVVEPEWIRDELSRALAGFVERDLFVALERNAADLRAAGFEPAIAPREAALVYRVDDDGRHALRAGGEGFRFDGEPGSRTGVELAAEIVLDLGAWSPGALLRPLAQDLCLPVAAYVGGAGELAYHAQLGALREAVGAPPTPFVLRRSAILVEPETAQALRRLDVEAELVMEGRLAERVDDALGAPPAALEHLRAAGERAVKALLEPRAEVASFDAALAQNLARTAGQVRSLVEKLIAKGERVHQNSSGKGRRHVRRVENSLRPHGQPQERVLGTLPFVARFGTGWIETLLAHLDPFERAPLIATFSDDGGIADEETT
ncbi:MAG TPA: bacillithiol biosynthesis cysteine-adding enzyme BshC [Planctomycetota bacterium]|nr:bacillithiol biosynthesis cysteine-adding enzyme BshC [Planctomycetota bacterium]